MGLMGLMGLMGVEWGCVLVTVVYMQRPYNSNSAFSLL